jgi:hypothetical protein
MMVKFKPLPGVAMSHAPWHTADDGTIIAGDGKAVCVLGVPEDDLTEQDIANGAAILALPKLIAAATKVLAFLEARQAAALRLSQPVPVFTGIAELSTALREAEKGGANG